MPARHDLFSQKGSGVGLQSSGRRGKTTGNLALGALYLMAAVYSHVLPTMVMDFVNENRTALPYVTNEGEEEVVAAKDMARLDLL